MEQITRYRIPILTGVGALVLAIIVFVAWISPEGGKLSSLHAQQTQLESQQTHLQTELTTLKAAKAHLASNCQTLSKDLGEIPGTPSVDSFFNQVTALAVASGDPNTPSISVTQAAARGDRWRQSRGRDLHPAGHLRPDDGLPEGPGHLPPAVHGHHHHDQRRRRSPPAGAAINPATAGYTLDLTGNIYYSSGQQNVCAATTTAAVH